MAGQKQQKKQIFRSKTLSNLKRSLMKQTDSFSVSLTKKKTLKCSLFDVISARTSNMTSMSSDLTLSYERDPKWVFYHGVERSSAYASI